MAAARLQTRPPDRHGRRARRLDRLPGPAGHDRHAQLRRRRVRALRGRGGARQGRGGRRHRARRSRTCTTPRPARTCRDPRCTRPPIATALARLRAQTRRRTGSTGCCSWRSPQWRRWWRRASARRWGSPPATVAVALFLAGAQLAFGAGVIVAVLPPLAAALTGIVGALLLANPVSHPWVNRVLDAVSRHGALNHRTRRLRALLLIGTALSVAAAALLLEATNALRGLELTTVDRGSTCAGAEPPPASVVLVAVDDKTFNEPAAATVAVRPAAARARDPAADEGQGASDRLRRPVHRADRRHRRRQRADRGRPCVAARRPGDDRGRRGRHDEHLRRRHRALVQPRDAGQLELHARRRRHLPAAACSRARGSSRSRSPAPGSRAGVPIARPTARTTRGSTSRARRRASSA